jgi:ribosomal protein S27AE
MKLHSVANKRRKRYNLPMPKNKVNLSNVLAALNTTCPLCGYSITPSEIVRIDFERQKCPKCGETFDAGKVRRAGSFMSVLSGL